MKSILVSIFVLLGISIFFYSCSNNPTSPAGSGILQVSLTDAAGSYYAVNVEIDSIQAHIANGDPIKGWYTLKNTNLQNPYDLTTLANGATTILGTDTLPAGRYSQIRLYLGTNNSVVLAEGQPPQTLTVPSGLQSGLKLNVDANIQDGMLYNITLDFDAARSIVVSGTTNNPQYILNPVIRSGASATTGIITGAVSPDTLSSVWAISSIDTSTTFTDGTGRFKLIYLTPNTLYTIYIHPNNTFKDTTLADPYKVGAGNTLDIGTVDLTPQ